jgi:hypothetical protein
MREVSYAESGNIQTDRNRVQNCSDGQLDNVCTLRDTYCADAVCLIQIDQPLSDAVIDRVRHIPNVVQATQLRF